MVIDNQQETRAAAEKKQPQCICCKWLAMCEKREKKRVKVKKVNTTTETDAVGFIYVLEIDDANKRGWLKRRSVMGRERRVS